MFRVGQKVVYIGGDTRYPDMPVDGLLPVKGVVYTVAKVGLAPNYAIRIVMLELIELPSPPGYAPGFNSRFFRPVVERKTDISFAHEILRKVCRRERA